MAMNKALGNVDLQFGVTESGLSNVLEQSANVKKLGELKEYKDREGNTVSVYKTPDYLREEVTFEVIIKAGANYKVGDPCTISTLNGNVSGVVSAFEITESNEDVKKARITVRTYPDVQ